MRGIDLILKISVRKCHCPVDWAEISFDTLIHVPGTPYNPQYAHFGRHLFDLLMAAPCRVSPTTISGVKLLGPEN